MHLLIQQYHQHQDKQSWRIKRKNSFNLQESKTLYPKIAKRSFRQV